MAETVNEFVFNIFVVRLSVISAIFPVVLIYWAYFVFSTPRLKRWTTPFNLGFTLLAATLLYYINHLIVTYNSNGIFPPNPSLKTTINYCIAVGDTLQASIAEISLAWMVYKVYPWKKFKIILPFIIFFVALRLASHIWTSTMLLLGLDPTLAGSIRGSILMWNLVFFSFLFIYRYRRKLKNAYKGRRFYKTVLEMSLRNAIIPTLFVFPAVITHFFTRNNPEMALANNLMVLVFRLSLGLTVSHSLYIINRGERGARKKDRRNIEMHTMNTRLRGASALTALNLVSSFGMERKTDRILENFLTNLHEIYGGTKGYFVEKNRFGQVNVICGFTFEDCRGVDGINVYSIDSANQKGVVPWGALEYGLQLMEPMIWDAEIVDSDTDELSVLLSDRKDEIDSILILPVTSPESGKQKIIYLECPVGASRNSSVDLQLLDLSAQNLAASLDSARLFEELEHMNRHLENMVQERTSELQLKTLLLEQAKREALEAAASKSIFLSNMSHEIRTPISQVVLASELMRETGLTNEVQEYVNIIANSGRLLLNLVNDILDLSKLESGKVTIESIPFNLFELIQITMDAFTVDENIKVAYYIQDGTPESVIGDETRLRQILSNLVSNAIKFTNEGYVLLFVSSKKVNDKEHDVSFKVVDTGCGIAVDKIDKIFQRFEQEDDSITRKFGGTGLGLSVCQNLCDLMDSHITVHSEVDHGSSFAFTIRFKQADITDNPPSRFLHTLDPRTKILLFQSPSFTFESKSILEYQLEAMGTSIVATTFTSPSESIQNLSKFNAIVVDLTNIDALSLDDTIQSLFATTLSKRGNTNVLVIYSISQREYVDTIILNRSNVYLIQHPHKQSTLFRQIAAYLSQSTESPQCVPSDNETIHGSSTVDVSPSTMCSTSDGNRPIDILLVEDNLINQKVVQQMISRLGYTVDTAANGLIALESVQRRHFDLILMDVRMPVMDGLESTRQIRSYYEALVPSSSSNSQSRNKRPMIVGLSADVLAENQDEGLKSGMDMYLSKPVSKAKLQQVISQVYSTLQSP